MCYNNYIFLTFLFGDFWHFHNLEALVEEPAVHHCGEDFEGRGATPGIPCPIRVLAWSSVSQLDFVRR